MIQVLQEVAAARNIIIKCGSTEIGGYAFCAALNSRSFDLLYEDFPDLQSLIRSVTYLIRGAVFRRKKVSRSSDSFSLRIRPLGELIEMFQTREASRRHDKVFALLGMSSDDPTAAGLLPRYEIPWERLLEQLVRFVLGRQVSVKTWARTETAVIKSKGCILGQVSSEGDSDRDDRQQVDITLKDASGRIGPERKWTFQTSAKPVQVGDLICLLHGASKPTVIRPCKDHFSVIMITVTPPGTESGSVGQPEQPIVSFPRDFLLVWDWERFQGNLQGQEYETLIRSRAAEHLNREVGGYSDKITRLWNAALILEDIGQYKKAAERLRETVEGYDKGSGKEDLRTLTRMEKLALIYKKLEQWEKAEKWFEQVIQARKRVQGADHPDTTSCMANLASTYRDQGHLKEAEKLEAIKDILQRKGDDIIEEEVVKVVRSFDEEVMKLLLDRKGHGVEITEGVVTAAAGNPGAEKE